MNCLQLQEQGFMRDIRTKSAQSQTKYKTNYCKQYINSMPPPPQIIKVTWQIK